MAEKKAVKKVVKKKAVKKVVKKNTATGSAKKKTVKKTVTKKKVATKGAVAPKNSRVQGTIKRTLAKSNEKEVTFAFYAPLSSSVSVGGSFNGWDGSSLPLKKDKEGVWSGSVALPKGHYEYRFLVDGCWENAQGDAALVDNGHGSQNNVLHVV